MREIWLLAGSLIQYMELNAKTGVTAHRYFERMSTDYTLYTGQTKGLVRSKSHRRGPATELIRNWLPGRFI